jgi:hypothetical protein
MSLRSLADVSDDMAKGYATIDVNLNKDFDASSYGMDIMVTLNLVKPYLTKVSKLLSHNGSGQDSGAAMAKASSAWYTFM